MNEIHPKKSSKHPKSQKNPAVLNITNTL